MRKMASQQEDAKSKDKAKMPNFAWQPQRAMSNSTGGELAADGEGKKKRDRDAINMNDQNWQLAQVSDPDVYFPN